MTCLISVVEVNPIGRRRTRVFCVCVHRFDIVVVVVVVVVVDDFYSGSSPHCQLPQAPDFRLKSPCVYILTLGNSE